MNFNSIVYKNKLRLLLAVLLAFLCVTPVQAVFAASDSRSESCAALQDISGVSCQDGDGEVNNILAVALNVLSIVAGVVAVIMLIISGLKYITSQGDATQIANAKKSLIYVIVGIVVVVIAQSLVQFVLKRTS